ncbi:MAG: glutamate synthase, partial [Propionibacteriaceae bacterium]|nr:glutamate synthase [Propionibacteriaceae bacterium]
MADSRDITALPDLAATQGRVGPTRSRMPVYVDLLPPCNDACPAGENIQEYLRLVKADQLFEAWSVLVENNP